MALWVHPTNYGKIIGNTFVYEEAGDCLEWHTHDFDSQHITIVTKGELLMEVRGEEPRTIVAGDLIDHGPGVWHQFTSLTADARTFNILKEPDAYKQAVAEGKYD